MVTVTSTARLPNLRRSDLGTLVGCTANNTDLVEEPPQSVFSVNMLREQTPSIGACACMVARWL